MFRPVSKPSIGVLALILLLSALLLPAVNVASVQATDDSSGISHRFVVPRDNWESMLAGDDRDLQRIIGTDERVRISPTNVKPYQSIAYLEAWNEELDMAFTCTATFVGPRTLLTAAHCLWIDEFGGWPDGVAIAPGKDGESNPFGFELAEEIWVPKGWSNETGNSSRRFDWDFGLVTLSSAALSDQLGTLEIGVLQDGTLKAEDFTPTTSGYPGDKDWGTQWTSSQPSFDKVTTTHLINSIDAFQGQSGSAVWGANDGRIIGIVSFENRVTNYALRITDSVLDGLLDGCSDLNCDFNYSIAGDEPEPTPEPSPEPSPTVPVTPSPLPEPPPSPTPDPSPTPAAIDGSHFDATWARTDLPVAEGAANRTWMWGPEAAMDPIWESYAGGQRAVQYYDKSRMEITNPGGDPSLSWYVTNGLLVVELITGELQTGEGSFEAHQPAQVNVAGDNNDENGPTYATFTGLLDAPAHAEGAAVTQRLDRSGTVSNDPALAGQGVTGARYVPETGHTVASVFWDFMNSEGVVFENGGFTNGALFENPFYATGYPISEPYWTTVKVAGTAKTVLVQAFQRRILTYTPDNPIGWQVEAGNVGQHYYQWRYEQIPSE